MEDPKAYEDKKYTNRSIVSFYSTFAKYLIQNLDWKDEDDIMDYGCGSGEFAKNYLATVANSVKIYGVDVSPKMIEFANKNTEENATMKFFVGNIMDPINWNLDDGTFDKLISYLVLIYITDYRLWFEKIFKLLKPGGQIGLLVPFSKAYGIPNQLLETPKWSSYQQNDDIKLAKWAYEIENGITDFKNSLESTGFKILKYDIEHFPLEFTNIDDLCEFLKVLTDSACKRIPKDELANFMEDMAKLAEHRLQISKDNGKPVKQDWKFAKIVAQK